MKNERIQPGTVIGEGFLGRGLLLEESLGVGVEVLGVLGSDAGTGSILAERTRLPQPVTLY